jgi:Fe-S-cluster containining protein
MCCGDTKTRARRILMLREEAQRISTIASETLESFALRIEGSAPYIYEMRKTADGKCPFLKGDVCAIYALRPLVCQYYPFELRMGESGGYVFSFTDECPGIGKGKRVGRDYFERLFQEASNRLH